MDSAVVAVYGTNCGIFKIKIKNKIKKAKTNKQKMPLQVFHAGKKYFSFYSR